MNMITIDWGRLVNDGRAKAVGVPWSDEEWDAVINKHIPAEYVREGCLTLAAYEETKKENEQYEKSTGDKPLYLLSKGELQIRAKELGIAHTDAATKEVLKDLIEKEIRKQERATAKAAKIDALKDIEKLSEDEDVEDGVAITS